MSGYLYFVTVNADKGFGWEDYKKKTKSRFKSLVVPYVIWNLLVVVLFAIAQAASHNSEVLQKDGYKLIVDYGFVDYLKAMWALDHNGVPMDGPLWFVRDLIVLSLLSPVIYILLSKLKHWGVLLMTVIMFSGEFHGLHGLSPAPWFYFSWGAYFGLRKSSLGVGFAEKYGNAAVSLLFVLWGLVIWNHFNGNGGITKQYYIIAAILIMPIALAKYINRNWAIWLAKYSAAAFFIYAIHKPMMSVLRRVTFAVVHPESEITLISLNIIVPIVTLAIAFSIYLIIKKYIPSLKFLNGFRM